jgi:hypothetical protein
MGSHLLFTFVVCIGWKGKQEEKKRNRRLFVRRSFWPYWVLSSGVLLARQALYYLSHTPSPPLCFNKGRSIMFQSDLSKLVSLWW